MSVSIEGLDDILKNIEAKLGQNRTNRIVNKALRETGEEVLELVKDAVSTYQDTGLTHETVIKSNVKRTPHKTIEVGWNAHSRWRLVHLNEFGYVRHGKFVRPRGMGKLQGAVDKTQQMALPKMQAKLRELAE